ncbi:MAG: penicillin-binding protein activator [Planctomycetes bacterium]|nr:penicillin-binding protein activator [Planctomycetota bacterium]
MISILTGEAAAYGEATRDGLELALEDIGHPSVKLIYQDSKADSKEAVRVFKELKAAQVPAIIGPFTSTEVRVVGPEAQREGIVLITSSATADDLSAIGDHVFMMLPPNSRQGSDQARFAYGTLGKKRAAVLYRQNPYGETLRKAFVEQFKSSGGEVVADEGFPDKTEDFQDRLREIAKSQPDVVFFPVHDADAGRILRQSREVGFPQVPFLGADGSMTDTTIKLAGAAAEGSIYSNVAPDDADFEARFKRKFGRDPSPYSASAYDSLRVLDELAAKGARTASDFQKGLIALKGRRGASGTTEFTKVDASWWALSKSYQQFEVRGGAFQLRRK